MSKGWYTKQDILNDLAEVTGRKVNSLDDRFTLRGEKPPPVNQTEDIDDEMLQMYGEYAGVNGNFVGPDLPGIKDMLRMVNDYYDNATPDDDATIRELKNGANTLISISKLNPNIPAFVPKNVHEITNEKKSIIENGNSSDSKLLDGPRIKESISKCEDNNSLSSKDIDEMKMSDQSLNNNIDITKKIDVSSLNSKDIKDIREKIKLKIVRTSPAECLKQKRERNLAMASLLKLYTVPKPSEESEPVKLMTPEYFETIPETKDAVKVETKQNVVTAEVIKEPHKTDIQPVNKTTEPINELASSSRILSPETSVASSCKSTEGNVKKQCNDLLMSKEVRESVKKVDKWLNGPDKKKQTGRSIYLGPVNFKRKESTSVTSATAPSLPTDPIERPLSAVTPDSYMPSSYANELTEKFMKRNKLKEIQNEDIWTKLERELKERDNAKRQQLSSPESQK